MLEEDAIFGHIKDNMGKNIYISPKPLDVEVVWPCSQSMYFLCKQLKFNVAARFLKYETLSSTHLAAFNFLSLWRMKTDTVIFIFLFWGSSFFVSSQCGMAKNCFRPLSLNEKTILWPVWICAGCKSSWRTESCCIVESLCNRRTSMLTLEMMVTSCTFWHSWILGVILHLESLTEQQLLASADTPLIMCASLCTHAQIPSSDWLHFNCICVPLNTSDCRKTLQMSACKCKWASQSKQWQGNVLWYDRKKPWEEADSNGNPSSSGTQDSGIINHYNMQVQERKGRQN